MKKPRPAHCATPIRGNVKVATLGHFRVDVKGTPVHLATKAHKTFELLKALVALGAESVTVAQLAESLWPDADGDRALGAFTTTLRRLRGIIGHDSLVLRAHRLSLDPRHCWVDAVAFAALVSAAMQALRTQASDEASRYLDQALGLYVGPFLRDEDELAAVMAARARLHGLYLRLVETFADHYCATRQIDRAVALVQRGLEVDDQAETLYRRMLRCYREQGRVQEASALYAQCRERLLARSGVSPSAETESLYRSALEAQPAGEALPISPAQEPIAGKEIRRSIAVLPFQNLTGDPDQKNLIDGITDDLITDLAAVPDLHVVASNTMFSYKGRAVNIRQIGMELRVTHVVEGSVRKSGTQVRLHAQLIDASTGVHLWAGRYDREEANLFAILDELVLAIVTELQVNLLEGEQARAWRQGTSNREAYELFLKALQSRHRASTWNDYEASIYCCERAVALDPSYSQAHAELASLYRTRALLNYSTVEESLTLASSHAHTALSLDPGSATARAELGFLAVFNGRADEARDHLAQALRLDPQNADAARNVALCHIFLGDCSLALQILGHSMRLAPKYAASIHLHKGTALMFLGRYEETLECLAMAQGKGYSMYTVPLRMAACFQALGQTVKAQAAARNVLEAEPAFRIHRSSFRWMQRKADRDCVIALLRQTGLPD